MLQGVAALRDRKTGEENAAHDEEKKMVQVMPMRINGDGDDRLLLLKSYGHREKNFH